MSKLKELAGIIKSFDTKLELENYIVLDMIQEFSKPGLVLLPAGRTFETEIYPMLNEHYQKESLGNELNPEAEKLVLDRTAQVHNELRLTSVDERLTEDPEFLFGESIKKALSNLADKFTPINPQDLEGFDRFIKAKGGPRLIYFGLGSDPSRAHVAYIGEDFVNSTTAIIQLSEAAIPNPKIDQALTIGTDIFDCENLEAIRVVVIGESKAESLLASFNDADTGLGFLLANHAHKLSLYCDQDSLSLLRGEL